MKPEDIKERIPENEFVYSASRSSGPGGQNVNKVNTRVELRFNIKLSRVLSDIEKEIIITKLKNKINTEGELVVTSQSERTQYRNKERALYKMLNLLSAALTENPRRKPTFPTLQSQQERLEGKRNLGMKKKMRKYPDSEQQE